MAGRRTNKRRRTITSLSTGNAADQGFDQRCKTEFHEIFEKPVDPAVLELLKMYAGNGVYTMAPTGNAGFSHPWRITKLADGHETSFFLKTGHDPTMMKGMPVPRKPANVYIRG